MKFFPVSFEGRWMLGLFWVTAVMMWTMAQIADIPRSLITPGDVVPAIALAIIPGTATVLLPWWVYSGIARAAIRLREARIPAKYWPHALAILGAALVAFGFAGDRGSDVRPIV